MFQLSKSEYEFLISQFVISKKSGRGGVRKMPYAFTEQGVAMLSSVLNSDRAIAVNIQIMRTFIRLRLAIADNVDLRKELEDLKQISEERFRIVFETLGQLINIENRPKINKGNNNERSHF
jgi:PAS domain-containing protein